MVWLYSILLLLGGYNNGASPYFHAVSVKSGEGPISLLRRYNLEVNTCNLEQFYTLNDLTAKDHLLVGKTYKIPVLIYPYNGKSIRSTIGENDWDKAVRIQEYNEAILQKGLRRTHFRESKILWVPFHEVGCNNSIHDAELPVAEAKPVSTPKNNEVVYSLFGPKYRNFKIEDHSLKGKVFYVVAGHGGPDPGAVATNVNNKYDLCEDEYAYDVSLRLTRALLKKGATAHMIIEDENDGIRDEAFLDCDKDEKCNGKTIPINQKKRLKQRADRINTLYREYKKKGISDQRVICLHVDSRGLHKRQDVFFYYYGKSRSGKKLAQNLHSTFNAKYKKYQSNRGYHGTLSARPLYMLRKTDAPAVYVELANIKNAKDRKRLVQQGNREALANWIAEGLAK